MGNISRRELLRFSAYGMASVVVSGGLSACGSDDKKSIPMSFSHGVASGDPLSDRVIIWTRALPDDVSKHDSLSVRFEVSTDENFKNVTNNGDVTVKLDGDFILKVDVTNLKPATQYFYRFTSNGITSVVGKTKTLPTAVADIAKVKLAVFSCANYPAGYFNAYHSAAQIPDLDAAVHLGDYIYEYAMGGYATENAQAIGRALPADNNVEIVTLADYRKRYALYRTDAALQLLHQTLPMIAVPDDHEITNDTYIDGAENHDSATEGDFTARKINALRAYFEWMPIRPFAVGDNEILYRQFQWGKLVNLMMLDTRIIARTKQLSLNDPAFFNTNGTFNGAAFAAAIGSQSRTLLGTQQLTWLTTAMSTSSATWQVMGQQVLMGRMNLPLEMLLGLGGGNISSIVTELVTIKMRILQGDPSVTPAQKARVNTLVPYNLDAWDGYQYEREVIFGLARAQAKNLVVFAGDTHNAWANNLRSLQGDSVGVEFATAGVTSPGLEAYLSLDKNSAVGLEMGLNVLVDDLQYSNLFERGYMVVTFTPEFAESEWHYVDKINASNYTLVADRTKKLKVLAGANLLQNT
jgi:alkaline phosphatase D